MKKLNIAILGYGVIGKGVFEICKNIIEWRVYQSQ